MNIELKADKEKQLLYGPFLIPNMLIYRKDEANGEYYVRFSKDEIEKIADKFNNDLNNQNINLMHTDEKVDAVVTQNWLIENEQDKSRNFGFDLPEGTWFGAVRVKDNDFWKSKVKTNEVKGFSVEILADLELSLKNKKQTMKKKIELGSTMLGDGTTPIFYDGEMIETGTAIFTDEAMTIPADDDRWVLEDGRTIVVVGGKVESIEVGETLNSDECIMKKVAEGMSLADAEIACQKQDMAETLPTQTQALTSDEVSAMIDARFGELMNEITGLKSALEKKDKEMNEYKAQVEEKFKTTPAVESVAKKQQPKVESHFSKAEQRIKEFAKTANIQKKVIK